MRVDLEETTQASEAFCRVQVLQVLTERLGLVDALDERFECGNVAFELRAVGNGRDGRSGAGGGGR